MPAGLDEQGIISNDGDCRRSLQTLRLHLQPSSTLPKVARLTGRPEVLRRQDTEPMKIQSISPIFSVTDLAQSIDFYRQVLGFDLAWSWGEPPNIAAVCRDSVEIMLIQRADAKPVGASHTSLVVSGIDDYYSTLVDSGVTVVVPIGERPYGMRDFRISDPSGNELSFGQVIAGEGEA